MLKLLVLCLMWLAWSGHYTFHEPLIAVFGAVSCVGVFALSRRMERSVPEVTRHTLGLGVISYVPFLLWEIVKANIAVTKIILSPNMPIRRQLVSVEANQRGAGARVLHANSITLTPGTIALAVRDTSILVHAIDDPAAEGVLTGKMNLRTRALEKTVKVAGSTRAFEKGGSPS